MALLCCCGWVCQATQPLQEVQVESPGLKHVLPSDAVVVAEEEEGWLPLDWQPMGNINTNGEKNANRISSQTNQRKNTDVSPDGNESSRHHQQENTPNNLQDNQQQQQQQQAPTENQNDKKSSLKTRNREGRMLDMAKREGLLADYEDYNSIHDNYDNKDDDGRLLLGTTGNQEVTISLNGLVAGILYTILGIFLVKFIATIITGRDLNYWGRWANDM